MARIHLGSIQRALVVENPAIELDSLLQEQGMKVLRLTHIPPQKELIKVIQENQIQVIFKRSKVPVN